MATEVWFRNPRLYIRQLSNLGQTRVLWFRGDLVKKRIEPVQHMKAHYGPSRQWRLLVVAPMGAHEYDQTSRDETDYKAVYPVWQYGESFQILEILAASNIAENRLAREDPTIDPFFRPVLGQEHRVVLMDLPPANSGAGRRFLGDVAEVQEVNSDAIIHLSGCWNYSVAFGFGTRSCDLDPHFDTGKNNLILPSGRRVRSGDISKYKMWANVLGFSATAEDYQDMDHVLAFNIASANWAGVFYQENEKFRVRNNINKRDFVPPQPTQSQWSKFLPANPRDMVTCETCSRKDHCKYYRVDAVCSVPGANVTELAKHFRTRDSGVIIDGLGALVALEVDRIREGRDNEVEDGRLDPHVTNAIDKAFKHGTDLAKLVDPALRVPKLAIQVNTGVGSAPQNLQVMAMDAVKALEARGIPRAEQTKEMILNEIGAAPPILEGRVIEDVP